MGPGGCVGWASLWFLGGDAGGVACAGGGGAADGGLADDAEKAGGDRPGHADLDGVAAGLRVSDDADLPALQAAAAEEGGGGADGTGSVEAVGATGPDGGQVDLLGSRAGGLLGEVERAGVGGIGLAAVIDEPEQDHHDRDDRQQENRR